MPIQSKENNLLFTGRKAEQEIIQKLLTSTESELLAITGRRRVGKTYLIKYAFRKQLCFHYTGRRDVTKAQQIDSFVQKLNSYRLIKTLKTEPTEWIDAFELLKAHITKTRTKKKKVVFLDELPWMATKRSGFLSAFDHFWNGWAVDQNIVVVICGSAASWMINNIVNNKGGLHNRITKYIKLKPFDLSETKAFLDAKKIFLPYYEILQIYMAIGGVPFYLKEIERGQSAIQNIDRICFSDQATLKDEFDILYSSLFENYETHLNIIKALASKRKGLSRNEIKALVRSSSGGGLTRTLTELEESSFIKRYPAYGKQKKDMLFRLTDEYSLFYLHFIEKHKHSSKAIWQKLSQTPKYKSWAGYSFESIVIKHVDKLTEAIQIAGIYSQPSSYSHKGTKDKTGFQIDLLLDRNDNTINICEIKFYQNNLILSKSQIEKLRNRKELFRQASGTKKLLFTTLITTYGFEHNSHSIGVIDNVVTMENLF